MDREMFITDYGYTVMQSEFYDTIIKYQSDEDIRYYISISELPFFEPTTNIEVLTLQNIVWNKSKVNQSNELAFQLYIEWKQIESDAISLYNVHPVIVNICDHYNKFLILGSKSGRTKNKIKRYMRNLNLNPRFGIYSYDTGIGINRVYYSLRDLDIAIRFEIKKLQKLYEKHKEDTLGEITFCFDKNFGLDFNLQIDKKWFINQLGSFLF